MNCVTNTILETEGPSGPASYPIHAHSEPAKYLQVYDVLDINVRMHVGIVHKVLYPNCQGSLTQDYEPYRAV